MDKPEVFLLGPSRSAVSGVSTHINLLFASGLAGDFMLRHFQVGSEGRTEGRLSRALRLCLSPFGLAARLWASDGAIVHINTSLNARAFWRDLAYLAVAKMMGARTLYQVHGGALPHEFFAGNRLLTALLRRILRMPDAVVVLAQSELQAYRRFVPEQHTILIPNGIDSGFFDRRAPRDFNAETLNIAYIGRLAPGKGLPETLQGLRMALGRGAKVRLCIAGSGPDQAALEQAVRESDLQEAVSFVGPVFGDDKLRLLQASHLFVLASHAEGLPYAVLESMAAGVPVMVTRVGAIPDVVSEGVHGVFIREGDADSIALAITRLCGNRDLLRSMGEAARQRIANHYGMERLSREFGRLYSDLSAARRAKAYGRT